MRETFKKYLRSFNRDYWQKAPDNDPYGTLGYKTKRDTIVTGISAALLATALPAVSPVILFLCAALPPAALFALRIVDIKTAPDIRSLEIILPPAADTPAAERSATLTGPARELRIFRNTQALASRLTEKSREYVLSNDIKKQLAPYFNDCAQAAARLEAVSDGQHLDSIPLTRPRTDYDDYSYAAWREQISSLPTRAGVEKKAAADACADSTLAGATAVTQATEGIGRPLTVKRIKLKVTA